MRLVVIIKQNKQRDYNMINLGPNANEQGREQQASGSNEMSQGTNRQTGRLQKRKQRMGRQASEGLDIAFSGLKQMSGNVAETSGVQQPKLPYQFNLDLTPQKPVNQVGLELSESQKSKPQIPMTPSGSKLMEFKNGKVVINKEAISQKIQESKIEIENKLKLELQNKFKAFNLKNLAKPKIEPVLEVREEDKSIGLESNGFLKEKMKGSVVLNNEGEGDIQTQKNFGQSMEYPQIGSRPQTTETVHSPEAAELYTAPENRSQRPSHQKEEQKSLNESLGDPIEIHDESNNQIQQIHFDLKTSPKVSSQNSVENDEPRYEIRDGVLHQVRSSVHGQKLNVIKEEEETFTEQSPLNQTGDRGIIKYEYLSQKVHAAEKPVKPKPKLEHQPSIIAIEIEKEKPVEDVATLKIKALRTEIQAKAKWKQIADQLTSLQKEAEETDHSSEDNFNDKDHQGNPKAILVSDALHKVKRRVLKKDKKEAQINTLSDNLRQIQESMQQSFQQFRRTYKKIDLKDINGPADQAVFKGFNTQRDNSGMRSYAKIGLETGEDFMPNLEINSTIGQLPHMTPSNRKSGLGRMTLASNQFEVQPFQKAESQEPSSYKEMQLQETFHPARQQPPVSLYSKADRAQNLGIPNIQELIQKKEAEIARDKAQVRGLMARDQSKAGQNQQSPDYYNLYSKKMDEMQSRDQAQALVQGQGLTFKTEQSLPDYNSDLQRQYLEVQRGPQMADQRNEGHSQKVPSQTSQTQLLGFERGISKEHLTNSRHKYGARPINLNPSVPNIQSVSTPSQRSFAPQHLYNSEQYPPLQISHDHDEDFNSAHGRLRHRNEYEDIFKQIEAKEKLKQLEEDEAVRKRQLEEFRLQIIKEQQEHMVKQLADMKDQIRKEQEVVNEEQRLRENAKIELEKHKLDLERQYLKMFQEGQEQKLLEEKQRMDKEHYLKVQMQVNELQDRLKREENEKLEKMRVDLMSQFQTQTNELQRVYKKQEEDQFKDKMKIEFQLQSKIMLEQQKKFEEQARIHKIEMEKERRQLHQELQQKRLEFDIENQIKNKVLTQRLVEKAALNTFGPFDESPIPKLRKSQLKYQQQSMNNEGFIQVLQEATPQKSRTSMTKEQIQNVKLQEQLEKQQKEIQKLKRKQTIFGQAPSERHELSKKVDVESIGTMKSVRLPKLGIESSQKDPSRAKSSIHTPVLRTKTLRGKTFEVEEPFGQKTPAAAIAEEEPDFFKPVEIPQNTVAMPIERRSMHNFVQEVQSLSSKGVNSHMRKSVRSIQSESLDIRIVKKVKHFKIRTDIHPFPAIDIALDRAKDQLKIFTMLTDIVSENRKAQGKVFEYSYLRQLDKSEARIDPGLTVQIQDGVIPSAYLNEGLHIMRDIYSMLEKIRKEMPRLDDDFADLEIYSLGRKVSSKKLKSSKSKEELAENEQQEILRIEGELIRLQKRYFQITNPDYMTELQNKIQLMEAQQMAKLDTVHHLLVNQKQMDKQIRKMKKNTEKVVVGSKGTLQIIDTMELLESDAVQDIRSCQLKIQQQKMKIMKIEKVERGLEAVLNDLHAKTNKLKKLASQKYGMDPSKVDVYLGKKPVYSQKPVKEIKQQIIVAQEEEAKLRYDLQGVEQDTAHKRYLKEENLFKLESLRAKLEKRIEQSGNIIDNAMADGDLTDDIRHLQMVTSKAKGFMVDRGLIAPSESIGPTEIIAIDSPSRRRKDHTLSKTPSIKHSSRTELLTEQQRVFKSDLKASQKSVRSLTPKNLTQNIIHQTVYS